MSDLEEQLQKIRSANEDALKAKDNELSELHDKLEQAKNDSANATNEETAALKQTVSSLEEQLQELRSDSESALKLKDEELSNLLVNLEQAQRDFEQAKSDASDALRAKEDELKQATSGLQEQFLKLRSENEDASKTKEDELLKLCSQLEEAQNKLADAEKSLTDARTSLEEAQNSSLSDDDIAVLQKNISELEEQQQKSRSEHEQIIKTQESELSTLRRSLEEAQSKAEDAEKSLAEARSDLEDSRKAQFSQDEIAVLQQSMSELEEQQDKALSEHKSAIKTRDDEISALRESLVEAQSKTTIIDKSSREVDPVQSHEGEVHDLQIVIGRFQEQVATLEKALEEKTAESEQASLSLRNEDSTRAVGAMQEQIANLEADKESLEKELQTRTTALEQTISNLEDQIQQAHISHESVLHDKIQELSELNEALEKAQAEATDSVGSLHSHQTNVHGLQATIDEMKEQVTTLESAKESLQKDLEAKTVALEQTVADLESQLRQAGSEHASTLEAKENELSEAREALEWARSKATDTENILGAKDNELTILRETLENVQTEASHTRKSLHQSRASIDGLQKSNSETEELLAQIQRERAESEHALQRRNAEINDLWASLEQSQAGSREALAELQSLRENNTAISDLEGQMKKLRAENEQALRSRDSEIRKLRESVERGELASSNLEKARTAMSDMETQFEEQLANLEHQVRSRQDEFDTLRESYKQSQADYAEMGDLLGATNQRLQKSYTEAERLQDELSIKSDEVFSLNVSLEAAQRMTAEKQAEITELRSSQEEVTGLRSQLAERHEVIEKAQAEAEALKVSLAEARIEISALQSAQSAGTELAQHIQYVHAEYEETLRLKNAEIEQHRAAFEKAQADAAEFARTLADQTAELEGLHKSLDALNSDGDDKDTSHAAAIAKVEQELHDRHLEELRSIQEAHTWELAGLQKEPTSRELGSPDTTHETLSQQVTELRNELAMATDEKFELMQKLDEAQGQHEREFRSQSQDKPTPDTEKKIQSLRADYDARVLEFDTRHRDLVRQQEETLETLRSDTEARLQQAEERRQELIREHEENLFNQAAEFEKSKNFSVDALNARHYTELKKRDDVIDMLRDELNSLKQQVQRLRQADTEAQSPPAINVETQSPDEADDRDFKSAQATPGAIFEEFITPMEVAQIEDAPQFDDVDNTQTSIAADSDAVSEDESYDMDFTHLESQIDASEQDQPSKQLTIEVGKQNDNADGQQPPTSATTTTTTSYDNDALTSQLAHLEAALESSRTETFHERQTLQSTISSLRTELSAVRAEKTSLQERLANFSSAIDVSVGLDVEEGYWRDGEEGGNAEGGKVEKARTVEGMLAGLRQQAKQLEELNEEFLSQSLRWSGVLPLR